MKKEHYRIYMGRPRKDIATEDHKEYAERQRERNRKNGLERYYKSVQNNEEEVAKRRQRTREYYAKNRESILAKVKAKRIERNAMMEQTAV